MAEPGGGRAAHEYVARTSLAWRRTVLALAVNGGLLLRTASREGDLVALCSAAVVFGLAGLCWWTAGRRSSLAAQSVSADQAGAVAAVGIGLSFVAVANLVVIGRYQ